MTWAAQQDLRWIHSCCGSAVPLSPARQNVKPLHVAACRSAQQELVAHLLDCWTECSPAQLGVAPELPAVQCMAAILTCLDLLLEHTGGHSMGLLLCQVLSGEAHGNFQAWCWSTQVEHTGGAHRWSTQLQGGCAVVVVLFCGSTWELPGFVADTQILFKAPGSACCVNVKHDCRAHVWAVLPHPDELCQSGRPWGTRDLTSPVRLNIPVTNVMLPSQL